MRGVLERVQRRGRRVGIEVLLKGVRGVLRTPVGVT